MALERLAAEVLREAEVENSSNSALSSVELLESWLGCSDNDMGYDGDLMEDRTTPLGPSVYEKLKDMIVAVWNPKEANVSHSNVFLERQPDDLRDVSLYDAMEPVRMTRILRVWMDLNVMGSSNVRDESYTLSDILLRGESGTDDDSYQNNPSVVVDAIYQHLKSLPQWQSQVHLYTQHLMRNDSRESGRPLVNVQSRLDRYQTIQNLTTRLTTEWEEHMERLEFIIGDWYTKGSLEVRRQSRAQLGAIWDQFVVQSGAGGVRRENTSASGIQLTLNVLYRILQGSSENRAAVDRVHEHLLTYHLIPLHRPNSTVLWRDQMSILELYHQILVKCVALIIRRQPENLIKKVIAALLEPEVWTKSGNTPKLVLLLHEIDSYIGLIPEKAGADILGTSWVSLLSILGQCISSDHSRLAERALSFFKNKRFVRLVKDSFGQAVSTLVPLIVRREPAWNPTVRKMTYHVLKDLMDYNKDEFLRLCSRVLVSDVHVRMGQTMSSSQDKNRPGTAAISSKSEGSKKPANFSLKASMGNWKPPSSSSTGRLPNGGTSMPPPRRVAPDGRRSAPPLGVTGVAPWAMGNTPGRGSRPSNPPLTVTGVAPWSMQKASPGAPKRKASKPLEDVKEGAKAEADVDSSDAPKPRILAYMDQIKPPEEDHGPSSWSKLQMAETPTLLPTLKFHDLVFGHDLGQGAFGSVKYARVISRKCTRSHWPEYAVKLVSTKKITELGYEASVQRELAILRILSHPGIARMVSSFRFRDGVYMVLEYASNGDLHSLLKKNGSLDHASSRFVIGSIVAALDSIHNLGFVYADLKPENVVITEVGHIKLTDFGGCRPYTEDAKRTVQSSAKNSLAQLRDGGWKPASQTHKKERSEFDMMDDDEENDLVENEGWDVSVGEDEEPVEDDFRIEGTTAYLPPEVVMGSIPTTAADAWALGCVLYQCLSGRPPILEDDDEQTRHRIVMFDDRGTQNEGEDSLFRDPHAEGIESDARDLIKQLLKRNHRERPSMESVAWHEFFQKAHIEVFSLYQGQAHPLDIGGVAPVADAKWSRRQFSSIWAPQPQAYDLSLNTDESSQRIGVSSSSTGPIPEGEEASCFFSKSNNNLIGLRSVSERPPVRPEA